VPHFILLQSIYPVRPPTTVDIGNQIFFDGAASYYYGSLRGIMGAWQTMVNLHARLQAALAVDGHDALYRHIFVTNPATACTACYSVYFDTGGAGFGWYGGIDMPGPDPTDSMWNYLSNVSIGLPGHEFGHSMHAGIAPASWAVGEDPTWVITEDSSGATTYARLPFNNGLVQMQEMGVALLEGFGDAMGNYFLNGCHVADRAWGDPDPHHVWMNPANYASCDSSDFFCPYRAFRFQMTQRGIAEGSPTWNARLASLSDLADQAAAAGAVVVTSDNEVKVSNFFCDLLDADSDVSYAAGQVAGKTYLPDYAWHAAERIDGRAPPLLFATYTMDPPPETVTLTLGQLLDAMQGFVTGPIHPGLPNPIVDGANSGYDETRMSYWGGYSAQALAHYLAGAGYATRTDLNGILRANYMEEIP